MGLSGVNLAQVMQQNQQPPAAPGQEAAFQQMVPPGAQQQSASAQPPQQQAPQQQQTQPQQQQQEDDPIHQQLVAKAQQALNAKTGVKQILQNFFSGISHGMMPPSQTPQFQQQQALANLNSYESTKSLADLRNQQAIANKEVPLYKLDGTPLTRSDGSPVTLPSIHAGPWYQAQALAAGRNQVQQQKGENAIDVQNLKNQGVKDVALINQGGGLQLPVDKTTATLAGAPDLEGKPLGTGGWKLLNSALQAKGYKVQDMGTDGTGPQQGTWIIDRAGNPINQITDKSITKARGIGFAQGRAMYTPFETVEPGTNIQTTISNLQAVNTGAPRIPIGQEAQLGTRYAQFNDAYGILDNIDRLAGKVDLSDNASRARITAGYAALKDPQVTGMVARLAGPMASEFMSNYLGRQPINASLKPEERELVLAMAQGKAAGTGLRGILGQAGTNEFQQRLDSGLFPGGQMIGDINALKQQTGATRGLLDRFVVGQPQAGLNAPGAPSALSNRMAPQNQLPTPTIRFTEGSDQYDIPSDKVARFKQLHPKAVPVGR